MLLDVGRKGNSDFQEDKIVKQGGQKKFKERSSVGQCFEAISHVKKKIKSILLVFRACLDDMM